MTIPARLKFGDLVRVVSPARSLAMISEDTRGIANEHFSQLGLELSFSKHAEEKDVFLSSSIPSRVEDLHDAFLDPKVKLIITTIGGFNSNQLLNYLDYDLIKKNPKIFCGYSDITALTNAIYAKTGLVTYSGPHYSDFGEQLNFEYTLEYFKKALFIADSYEVFSSKQWSNDRWYKDQKSRTFIPNQGFISINEGEAEGIVIGGNLRTFHYLAGTEFLPKFNSSVLFIEEDSVEDIYHFDSHLTAISQLPDFKKVVGVIIGRFEPESKIILDDLRTVIANNRRLDSIPVVYGVDFGHTTPKITFPIGGKVALKSQKDHAKLKILTH